MLDAGQLTFAARNKSFGCGRTPGPWCLTTRRRSVFKRTRYGDENSTTMANSSMIEIIMNPQSRIVIDPEICHGKPVIRGTRVPVTVVVGSLASGMTFENVQREYDLTDEDIRAALRSVGELAEQESFHPLPVA